MARTKTAQQQFSPEREERRLLAESNLEEFIRLVHPRSWLGNIHREVIEWWERQGHKRKQGLLLPRGHRKSTLAAYRAAWRITKNPSITILYISSTSNLATKQLKFIKDILTSDTYRAYWPNMIEKDEAKREKWTEREISVDHPQRKEDMIRDPTIFTAGLTSNIVGLHCDIAILDDVVVETNAYLEDGREKVRDQYSYLSSVENPDAEEWFVGTRYHPNDLYSDLQGLEAEELDDYGNLIRKEPVYEIFEKAVESAGDGTGEFIWPRSKYPDGKWFGFDARILSDKREQYLNKVYFRAQYYNDPNDIESSPIQRDLFQYYDQGFLSHKDNRWSFRGRILNVFAAVDFAFSLGEKADYTSIVVIGVDSDNDYYVLEIDRFKTLSIADYYMHILRLHEKWGFRKLRAEVSVAQKVIVNDLKENYIRKNGLALAIDEYRPSKWQGSKEERIRATLEPKYANKQIWHYKSGNCQALEEELIFTNPSHDDIKDALASVIDFAIKPSSMFSKQRSRESMLNFHSKFGGVI